MIGVLLLCGCRKPVVEELEPPEGEFSSKDWEDLTGALMDAGREGDVDGFKARVHPDTVRMFEESWAGIVKRIDEGIEEGGLGDGDVAKLEQLKAGCTWEALSKNYRPGRLLTITPEGDKYRVKEILPAGRKVDYLVVKGEKGWLVYYENDSRWFRQLEALAYAGINHILSKAESEPAE
jgi:hypothetical protein